MTRCGVSDPGRPPRTSFRYELLASGLIATNVLGWFVFALIFERLPRWGAVFFGGILSLPIAWPLPWIAKALGADTFWGPTNAVLALFGLVPWMWLNAVLWGRGLAWGLNTLGRALR